MHPVVRKLPPREFRPQLRCQAKSARASWWAPSSRLAPGGGWSLAAHERQLRVGELVPQLCDSRLGEVLLAFSVGQAFANEVGVLHEFGYEHTERGGTSELRRTRSRRGRR